MDKTNLFIGYLPIGMSSRARGITKSDLVFMAVWVLVCTRISQKVHLAMLECG